MINKNDGILFKTIIDKRTSDEFLRKIEDESNVLLFTGLPPTSFNPFKHPNNCYNSLYLILKKKDENIFLSFGTIDNILDLDDDEKYLENKNFLEICSELCPKIKEEKMEDDVMIQTIVSRENWNNFAEEISNNSFIRWISNEKVNEWSPFNNENCNDFCLVRLSYFDKNMPNGTFLSVINNIDFNSHNVISNGKFLNICKVQYPKKIKNKHFCSYVLREEWIDFIELLDKITNGKEFIIGKSRVFYDSVGMEMYNRNRASYFNYFNPFNKKKWNKDGLDMSYTPPFGVYIHYELDGEKEKIYVTENINLNEIGNINIEHKTNMEFLNLMR